MKMHNTSDFIRLAKAVHHNRYDYSKVEYVNNRTKVCIICPEHGEFYQKPSNHLRGNGCPKCANYNRGSKKRLSKDDFIKKANEVHRNKYDYSKVEYTNSSTKVCIICKEHGEFWQLPMNHLNGQGCPKCSGHNLTKDEVIEQFRIVHGSKYDYSKFELTKMNDKSCIICPEHGEFWQSPTKHIIGQGCPECGKTKNKNSVTFEEVVKRSNEVHRGKYLYKEQIINSVHDKISIICPIHGMFNQNVYDHMNGHGCPVCGKSVSNSENELYEYICGLIGEKNVVHHDRNILGNGKEIDIYIPLFKVGIEYDGIKWHTEEFKTDKNYHIDKTEICAKKGIRLIHIFEDEYKYSKDIVLSKIRHLLFCENLPKIMGRKCKIQKISYDIARGFLDENHIQGFSKSTLYYGAFFGNCLVGVMTFLREKDSNWIMNRFATEKKFICQGVGGKLFKQFIKENNPDNVKSFADRRWTFYSMDNVYIKLGFRLTGVLRPDYRYVNKNNPDMRIHKFNFRKKILNKFHGLSMDLTESEMTKKLGYYRIWDCGLYRYEWTKKAEV
jgi:hypothetical protein